MIIVLALRDHLHYNHEKPLKNIPWSTETIPYYQYSKSHDKFNLIKHFIKSTTAPKLLATFQKQKKKINDFISSNSSLSLSSQKGLITSSENPQVSNRNQKHLFNSIQSTFRTSLHQIQELISQQLSKNKTTSGKISEKVKYRSCKFPIPWLSNDTRSCIW